MSAITITPGKRGVIALALLLLCLQQPSARAQTHAWRGSGYPGATPRAFLDRFAESAVLQEAYTDYPVTYTYIETNPADPDHMAEKSVVVRRPDDFPFRVTEASLLFPSADRRRADGDALKVEARGDRLRVMRYKPDTDDIAVYVFRRMRGCWFLKRVESKSL